MMNARGTLPDGQEYYVFGLDAAQVQRLAAGGAVRLQGERLGLQPLVVVTGGLAGEAVTELLGPPAR